MTRAGLQGNIHKGYNGYRDMLSTDLHAQPVMVAAQGELHPHAEFKWQARPWREQGVVHAACCSNQTVIFPGGFRSRRVKGQQVQFEWFRCPFPRHGTACTSKLALGNIARHVRDDHRVSDKQLLFRRCLKHTTQEKYIVSTHPTCYREGDKRMSHLV